MAGDCADGLIGHPICSLRWLDEVLVANFEQGLARSGRDRSDFDFIPTVSCAISDDEQAAYEAARRTICFYATVRTYAPLWEMHGFGDAAAAVGEAFRAGDFAAMPSHVPDEMVDAYCAAGPLDKVRARVAEVAERGDGVFLTPPSYFISAAEIAEYQRLIVEAFAPGAELRGESGVRRQPAADELHQAGEALADVLESPLLERGHDLVRLEHAHAAGSLDQRLQRRKGELAAHRGHDRDPPARRQHPPHLVERRERIGEQMQGGEAAETIEDAVRER